MATRRPRQKKIVESGVQAPRQATPDILDLPGVVTGSHKIVVHKKRRFRFVEAEIVTTIQKNCCLKCGSGLYKYGTRKKNYFDSPIREYPTIIRLKAQRFKCKNDACRTMIDQPVDGMDPIRSMTTRCVELIRERSLRDTFLHVAEHIGCDDKIVRQIANTYFRELNKAHHPYLPEWLGIDEVWLQGRYRCVLTDIGERRPIDLLKDHKKKTVAGWLWKFREDCHQLKGVTMDMSGNFKAALHAVFKTVPIVIDRFHAVKMANKALDDVRNKVAKRRNKKERQFLRANKGLLRMRGKKVRKHKEMQKKLDRLLAAEPEIKAAYDVKEQFSQIFDLGKKDLVGSRGKIISVYEVVESALVESALKDWRDSVPEKMRGHFKDLITASKNWKGEILAYFAHTPRRTNGYTEGLNSKIKAINRQGRGYDFDGLRARVLFASAVLADQEDNWDSESEGPIISEPERAPTSAKQIPPITSKPEHAATSAKQIPPITSKPEHAATSAKQVSPIISEPERATTSAKQIPPITSKPEHAATSAKQDSPIISEPERAGLSISDLFRRMGCYAFSTMGRRQKIHYEEIYDMMQFPAVPADFLAVNDIPFQPIEKLRSILEHMRANRNRHHCWSCTRRVLERELHIIWSKREITVLCPQCQDRLLASKMFSTRISVKVSSPGKSEIGDYFPARLHGLSE